MGENSGLRKYGQRVRLDCPWLPEVWADWESEPTAMFKRINRTEYPPLFASKSWTKGVPEKDAQMYLRPSETIGIE